MSILENYCDAYKILVDRAISINNAISELHFDEDLTIEFKECLPMEIYEDPDRLKLNIINGCVELSYTDQDDYTNVWSVPTRYLDMTDEEAVKQFIIDVEERNKKFRDEDFKELVSQAAEFGYKLVPLNEG